MSVQYQAIGWNRQKKTYDLTLAAAVVGYLLTFVGLGSAVHPNATAETLFIRALGTLALLLLHVILAIGPLCRLDSRFLPLLYNRRHLGVTMFVVALAHGVFSIVQFHALGNVQPLVSLVSGSSFQLLGFAALLILFVMAATSHDFWLHNLSPAVWKRLHMSVYLAYGLLIAHVSFGVLQQEQSPVLFAVLFVGVAMIVSLHLIAGRREVDRDRVSSGFAEACTVDAITEGRGKAVTIGSERIAIFKHEGRFYAMSNVCRHQNGPLGEGRIIDGCVTCPWHGYQYKPDTGMSPPPFTDKVPTYATRVEGNKVLVNPCPRN